jgi:uncharacterized protein YjbJ (UPF0337 family)
MEIIEVDWVTAAADWRNFRGAVRTNWLRLTDVDLAGISGDRACLATRIQARYGLSSAQVEQQMRTFEARCEYFRTVSSR